MPIKVESQSHTPSLQLRCWHQCGLYYIDDLLPHAPLKPCGYWECGQVFHNYNHLAMILLCILINTSSKLFCYCQEYVLNLPPFLSSWARLVPRPFEGEEKGPGTHCIHMREVYGAFSGIIHQILSIPRSQMRTDKVY